MKGGESEASSRRRNPGSEELAGLDQERRADESGREERID